MGGREGRRAPAKPTGPRLGRRVKNGSVRAPAFDGRSRTPHRSGMTVTWHEPPDGERLGVSRGGQCLRQARTIPPEDFRGGWQRAVVALEESAGAGRVLQPGDGAIGHPGPRGISPDLAPKHSFPGGQPALIAGGRVCMKSPPLRHRQRRWVPAEPVLHCRDRRTYAHGARQRG